MTLWPNFVLGQDRAGVVTTLEGNVTAARSAITQPVTLKFRDDVYMNDRITTGDRSLARMLLGGKAVVTVRERSVITITETTNKSTIDLVSGKIGLAVAKERMRPGEQIEVKTPNAVAAVRGTVIVAEVERATAQAGGPGPAAVTNFWVLRGAIECRQLAPGTNTPIGGPLAVTTLQSFTAIGIAPPRIGNIAPGQLSQIIGGLRPSGLKQGHATTDKIVKDQASTAAWLSDSISSLAESNIILPPITPLTNLQPPPPPPTTGPAIVTIQPPPGLPPGLPGLTINQPDGGNLLFVPAVGGSGTPQPLSPITADINPLPSDQTLHPELATFSSALLDQFLLLSITRSLINAPNSTVLSVAGSLESTVPAGLLSTQTTTVNAQTIADISGTLKLSGPLLTDLNGVYDVSGNFLTVTGTLNETGTPPATASGVLVFQGSQVTVGGNLVSISGNATLNGPLVVATNTSLQVGGAVLVLSGTLTANSPFGLLSFDPTTVSATNIANIAGTLSLAGPLLTDVGGTYHMAGDFVTVSGTIHGPPNAAALPALLVLNGTTIQPQAGVAGVNLVNIAPTGNVTVDGLLVAGTNATLQLGTGVVLALGGTLTSSSAAGLLFLDPTTVSGAGIANITGTLKLAGPLLTDLGGVYSVSGDFVTISGTLQPTTPGAAAAGLVFLGSQVTVGGNLLKIPGQSTLNELLLAAVPNGGTNADLEVGGALLDLGGTLTSNAGAGVLYLDRATVTAASVANIGGTLSLAGALLTDFGGLLSVSGNFLTVSGTLNQTGVPPATAPGVLVFQGSQVTVGGNLVSISGNATLNGPLVVATGLDGANTSLQVDGAVLVLGGTLTANSPFGLLSFDPTTVSATNIANIAGTLSLAGPLLTDFGGTYHMAGDFVAVSGTIHGPPDAAALPALLVLDGTTIQPQAGVAGVNLVNIAPTGNVTVDGLLVVGTNATLQLGSGAVLTVSVGGVLTGNSPFGLLVFDPTTVTAASVAQISGTLNLAGPLLTDFGGLFNVSNNFLTVTGTLNQTGVAPATAPGVLVFQGSQVTVGGNLASISGNATLNGPLVVATSLDGANTSLQVGGAVLVLSGTLTANSPAGLLNLDPTTVSAAGIANISGTLNLAGPLLTDVGGTYHMAGDFVTVSGTIHGPPDAAALPALLVLNGTTIQPQAGAGVNLVNIAPTGNVTVDGLLVVGTNATLQLGTGAVLTVGGILTGNSPFGLLGFDPTTVTAASVAQISGTLNLAGPLLTDFGGTFNIAGDVLKVAGTGTVSPIEGSSPFQLLAFNTSTVNAATLANIAGTLSLAGPLLTDVLGTYNVSSDFVSATGTLNQTGVAPATAPGVLVFQGAHVSAGGNLVSIGGNATLNGPLVVAGSLNGTNTSLQLGGAVLALSGTLTANSPFGLLSFDPTTVTAASVAQISGTLNLAGPLLIDTAGTYRTTGDVVTVSGTVQAPPGSGAALPALLVLNGTSVQPQQGTAGMNLVVVEPTGHVTVDGLLVVGANATLQLGTGTVVKVGGALTGNSPFGLLGFDPTTVTAASVTQISGTLNLAGPLLTDAGGTYNVSGDFVAVGGTLQQNTAPPGSALIVFDGSAVNSGTNSANTDFFRVNGGTVTLAAPLLRASGSSLTQRGHALIEVTGNGHLTGNSADALVNLVGGSLTLGNGVHAVVVDAGGALTLTGGLLKASGTTLAALGGVAFVELSNGSLTAGVGPVLDLIGTTLDLGAQPLISSNSASTLVVGVGGGVKLSSATLIADALYHSDGTGNHAVVNGTILDLNNSSVTLRVIAQDSGSDAATFGLASGQPLYKLANNSHLTLTGANAALVERGADGGPAPSLAGVGLIATGGSIALGGSLMRLSGVTLTDTDPQLQLTGTDVTTQQSLIRVTGLPLTMSGSALKITGGSLATLGSLLDVQFAQLTVSDLSGGANKGVLDLQSFSAMTLGSGAPMVSVQNATLTSNIPVLSITGVSSLTGLSGPVVELTNSTVTLAAPLVRTGGQIEIATSAPFLTVSGGTLIANSPDGVLNFDPTTITASSLAQINGVLTLTAGSLLTDTGGKYTVSGDFVTVSGNLTQTGAPATLLNFHGAFVQADNLLNVAPNALVSLTGPLAYIDSQGAPPWMIDRFVFARCGSVGCSSIGTGGLETSSTAALITLNGTPLLNGNPAPHKVNLAMFDLAGVHTQTETAFMAAGLTVGTDQPLHHAGVLFQGQNTQLTAGEVVHLDTALLAATAPIVSLLSSSLTVQGNAINLVNQAKLTADVPGNSVFTLSASTLALGGSLVNVAHGFMSVTGNLFSLSGGSTLNILNGALVSVSDHGVFQLTGGSLGVFGSGTNQLHILATPGGALATIVTLPNFPYPVALIDGATAAQLLVAANFSPFTFLGGTNTLLIDPGAALLLIDGSGALIVLGDFTQTIQLNVVNIVQNPNLHLASNETLDPQLANLAGFGNFPGGSTLVKVQNKSHATQDAGGNLLLVPAGANVTLGGLLLEVSDSTVQAGNAVVRVDGVLSASGLLRFDPAGATATTMAEVNGTVNLAGPLFTDVQGTFDISGDFLKVSGTLTTSTSSALVDFDRSAALVGQSMFDLVGVNTASDPDAGIVVGTDKPLRHAGILLQAEDASLTVGQVVRIDTALLEATAPVVQLIRSNLTVQGNAIDLVNQAKLAVNVPLNAVFNLNASTLTVAGSLVNVANSFMTVIGNLFSLTGGSTLNINGGALVTASGSGVFQLTGGSLGVFGTGTNALNITATPGAAGHIITTIPNLVGVPVALLNGAQATQVTVAPGFTPFSGVGGSNSVSIAPTGAALVVNGPGAKIKLGP